MTTRVSVAALFFLLAGLAAACSVERLPVPSDAPAFTAVPRSPSPRPIETPWAITVDAPPDATSDEVLGAAPGSVLVGHVQWLPRDPKTGPGPGDFSGQPAVLKLAVIAPDGGKRDVATLFLPTGMAFASLGPTGYLAISMERWELGAPRPVKVTELAVLDMRDLLGGEVGRVRLNSPSDFAWSPDGRLALTPATDDGSRLVFDPETREERLVEPQIACCTDLEWTADGTAWFALATCDPPCESGPGLVDAATGEFRRTDDVPLPYPGPLGGTAYHRFDRHGWLMGGTGIDNMGNPAPSEVVSYPAMIDGELFDHPQARIWWDSRIDADRWIWQGWDTDGEGILALRTVDGTSLELTRYDAPRKPQALAQLPADMGDPNDMTLLGVRDVAGSGVPDLVLEVVDQQDRAQTRWLWFSGTSGRLIEVGRGEHTLDTLEIASFFGWIGD